MCNCLQCFNQSQMFNCFTVFSTSHNCLIVYSAFNQSQLLNCLQCFNQSLLLNCLQCFNQSQLFNCLQCFNQSQLFNCLHLQCFNQSQLINCLQCFQPITAVQLFTVFSINHILVYKSTRIHYGQCLGILNMKQL